MATNKQNIFLYAALLVIVGLVAGYLGYQQFSKPAEAAVPPPPVSNKDTLQSFQNLKINFSLFDSAAYKSLQIFGEMPVNPGSTGKKDIFAP
ncbi:MAG TPA: hypothetical protein VFK07_00675 [Candidatus Paceibacterota bacterium]|nr:hypothetical protein [Candidatus Paceibacterota bacterium]